MLSKDNKLVKTAIKLKQKKYREIEGKFIAEGLRFVEEAIKEGEVEIVFYSEKFIAANNHERLLLDDTLYYEVSEDIMKQICDTETPQGIAAIVKKRDFMLDDIKNNFIIIADGIQDPGNLGTIIRTADAAGAGGLCIIKGSVDVYNSKTLRSTMGSIFHIPIIFYDSFEELVIELKEKNYRIYGSSLDTDKNLYDYDFKLNTAVAIGNEANGMPKEHLSIVTDLMKIPMPGGAESLNAGIAAAVIMYEVVRQRL